MEKIGTKFETFGPLFNEDRTYEIVEIERFVDKEGSRTYYNIEITNRESGDYIKMGRIEQREFRKIAKMGYISFIRRV